MTNRAPKPSKTLMFRLYDNRKNHNLILNWLLNELPQTNRGTDICYTLENILLAHIKKTCTEEEVRRFKETPAPPHPKSRDFRSESTSRTNQTNHQPQRHAPQATQKAAREDDFGDFDQKPPILQSSRSGDTISEGNSRKSGRMGSFVKNADFGD